MKINQKNALKIWIERYGDSLIEEDFDGGIMYRDAYGDENAWICINNEILYCGWNLHHILPISNGGTNDKGNLECTNIVTNERAGNKTTFIIDGTKYQVKKVKGSRCKYQIVVIG